MEERVSIQCGAVELKGDIFRKDEPPRLVFLPGAGLIGRARFDPLRKKLLERGVGSAAVDFPGCGETAGSMEGSSLADRVAQATAFIRSAKLGAPLALLGSSLSGEVAIRLIETFDVSTLILNVPAVYDRAAYTAPFGPEFSKIIREPLSWHRSAALELLKSFRGRFLVISAELDTVIPPEVIDRLLGAAVSAAEVRHKMIRGRPHRYLDGDETACSEAAESIENSMRLP